MKETLRLHAQNFVSSSHRTPQYLQFHRTLKREFTKALLEIGCTNAEISKPNHFDVSGFFTAPNGQIWYFSLDDLRWNKDSLLIRTAKHYKDFSGGSNNWVTFNNNIVQSIKRLI